MSGCPSGLFFLGGSSECERGSGSGDAGCVVWKDSDPVPVVNQRRSLRISSASSSLCTYGMITRGFSWLLGLGSGGPLVSRSVNLHVQLQDLLNNFLSNFLRGAGVRLFLNAGYLYLPPSHAPFHILASICHLSLKGGHRNFLCGHFVGPR